MNGWVKRHDWWKMHEHSMIILIRFYPELGDHDHLAAAIIYCLPLYLDHDDHHLQTNFGSVQCY